MEDNFIKITNATYRALDFLPEGDPLKNKAKEKVLAILEHITLISEADGWISLQKEKASAQVLDDIGVLENYLTIAKGQGWIDTMNFLIITSEYQKIKSSINPPRGIVKQSLQLAAGLAKENMAVIQKLLNRNQGSSEADTTQIYSKRQEKILEVLRKKEKAQVSDFIKELPNITKRTVRRDLDDLLKKGKVVRVGEWNQVFYKSAS